MFLCYIDESGTSDIPGNTSHFILAGLSIPITKWKYCDNQIAYIKKRFYLENEELHTAWILRPYLEQSRIPNFERLDKAQRISEVQRYRRAELLRLQRTNRSLYKQTKKNYQKTEAYIHLTFTQRKDLLKEVAECVSKWGFARLFAECVDKIYFDPSRRRDTIDEQCLEQLVSRFEHFLKIADNGKSSYGLLIHDNNETLAKKHTNLMKRFHNRGTFWTSIKNIIETPLFVDSQLTSMVQIADLCSYALRRYLENGEIELFDLISQRADRKNEVVVGVRHYTDPTCVCTICVSHKKPIKTPTTT